MQEHHELKERCLASNGDQHLHDRSDFEYHCLLCCNKLSELFDLSESELSFSFPVYRNSLPCFSTSHHFFQPFYSTAQRAPPALL